MAIQFPANPTNGQVYQGYYYDSTLSAWKASPVSAGPVAIADVAPTGAIHGDMWYNSLDGSSYIYVNDGTSSQWVEVHSNTAALPGSILQVQTVQLSSRVTQTVAASGDGSSFMSITLTPKLASSKIIIQFFVNGSSGDTARYQNFGISVFKNSSKIGQGDADGSALRLTSSFWGTNTDSAASSHLSGTVIDMPNTTSSITYDIRPSNNMADGSRVIYINGPSRNDSWATRGISTLVVWEVAQ